MTEPPLPPTPPEVVEELADLFAHAVRAGEPITVEKFVAAHPEHAVALRDLLPTVLAVEELKARRLALAGRHVASTAVGGTLGDYRIEREIGRGGMGIVYEATQLSLARTVALKVLPHTAFLDAEQVARFQNEARTVSRLQHPHIVPIHAIGTDAGVHYFAMPLIPGVGLDRVLRALEISRADAGAMTGDAQLAAALAHLRPEQRTRSGYWRRLALLGADLAEALDHAHRHGVVHRDVKPANLLLEQDGRAWITDFGVAKSADHAGLTDTGDFVGTLHYVPPEFFEGVVDARGDVYGLGLSLLELALGAPVWVRGPALIEQVRRGVPRTLRQLDREAPRDLSVVLAKATALDPAHRYGNAGMFAADLRRFAADQPIVARPASTAVRVFAWCRRNRLAAAFAASSAGAVVAAAIIGWTSYLTTRDALHEQEVANGRATQSLAQAQAATRLAESNLAVALASYDEIFTAIARTGAHDAEPGDVPVLPPLTAQDLEVLQRVLTFYEQFGKANADNARLRHHASRAFSQVGDIRRWTGEMRAACEAYERAIVYHESVATPDRDDAWVITMAGLRTRLALARECDSGGARAVTEAMRARTLLSERIAEGDSPSLRYELARAWNTIGVITARGTPTDSSDPKAPSMMALGLATADEAHARAVDLARRLVADDAQNPAYLLLLARSNRLFAQARLLGRPREGRAASLARVRESVQVLEAMVAKFPDEIRYRCECLDAESLLARVEGGESGTLRLDEALAQVRRAVAERPGMPDFEDLLARVLRRAGDAAAERGDRAVAQRHYEECVSLRQALIERFPRAVHHLWELLQVRRTQARTASAAGEFALARQQLEHGIEIADRTRSPLVVFAVVALERDLIDVLTRLGDTEARQRAATRASERWQEAWAARVPLLPR